MQEKKQKLGGKNMKIGFNEATAWNAKASP